MTPSPQGTTPSQAPAMSREEWKAKWMNRMRHFEVHVKGGIVDDIQVLRDGIVRDIMSLQAEVERLRAASKSLIDAWSSGSGACDDTRQWFMDHMDKFESAIEKARQPK